MTGFSGSFVAMNSHCSSKRICDGHITLQHRGGPRCRATGGCTHLDAGSDRLDFVECRPPRSTQPAFEVLLKARDVPVHEGLDIGLDQRVGPRLVARARDAALRPPD